MPCAISTDTAEKDNIVTMHVSTVVYIPTCCNIHPVISAKISGVAGTVTHICASIIKMA